jgi:hypothetical protein
VFVTPAGDGAVTELEDRSGGSGPKAENLGVGVRSARSGGRIETLEVGAHPAPILE